jgi:UMF1 family MFS transporter
MTDAPTPKKVPTTANTGAIAAVGLDLQEGKVIPKKQVWSWALWDWATQPFASVITTFVFTVYLTSSLFIDPALEKGTPAYDRAISDLSAGLGLAITVAGLLVAVLAPVLGQRSDAAGRRKLWLGINTALVILAMGLMFFVQTGPAYFVFGVALVAIGNVFAEIANVNYNAMLVQVSTPKTVGRVSGLGWGFGYLGGIIVLLLVYVLFIAGDNGGALGVGTEAGIDIRLVALTCAIWTLIFSIPIFLNVPEHLPDPARRKRVNFFASYGLLVQDIIRLFRESRPTFWFLLASAVFRDGLAGVFTFGGVIAAVTFGFSPQEVLIFGIVANLTAGLSTIIAGRFDDRFGPRAVIAFSLAGLIVAGLAVFFAHDGGTTAFWIGGLVLTLFVGPAQAASRSFLARVTPAGREGEIFGLYATTGRAASFLSPLLWTMFIAIGGAQYWGILGIVIVLAVGLALLMLVKVPTLRPAAPGGLPGSLG